MTNLLNLIIFQSVWFIMAYSAAYHKSWIGILALLLSLCFYVVPHRTPKTCLLFFMISGLMGLLTDTLFIYFHVYDIHTPYFPISPPFMIALWVNLATTFDWCMSWTLRYTKIALLFVCPGAALSYYAGTKIGALTLAPPLIQSLLIIGIAWIIPRALITPQKTIFKTSKIN